MDGGQTTHGREWVLAKTPKTEPRTNTIPTQPPLEGEGLKAFGRPKAPEKKPLDSTVSGRLRLIRRREPIVELGSRNRILQRAHSAHDLAVQLLLFRKLRIFGLV